MGSILLAEQRAFIIRSTTYDTNGLFAFRCYYVSPRLWCPLPYEATIFSNDEMAEDHVELYKASDYYMKPNDQRKEVLDIVPLYGEITVGFRKDTKTMLQELGVKPKLSGEHDG